jgi:hypothetical protein
MARRKNQTEENPVSNDDVDIDFDTTDEVEVTEEATAKEKPAKAKKEPVRGKLPEGYVTPIALAKAINERELAFDRNGNVKELKPQELYSYIKNSPKDLPFPSVEVEDSLGKARANVTTLEQGLEWWTAKNERTQSRRASAAEKKAAKEQRAKDKASKAEETVEVDDSDVESFVDA